MNALIALYGLTMKGIWRERWPYLVFPLYLFCFLVSHVLASFSIGRDRAVLLDFGLMFIQALSVLTSLYMVHLNWSKELEGPSAAFFLSRPVSRNVYVVARFGAMSSIMAFLVFGGALLLMIMARMLGAGGGSEILVAAYGIFLMNLVLLSFGTMTAHLSTPLLGLLVSLFFFVAAMLSSTAVEYMETRKQTAAALGVQDSMGGFYSGLAAFVQIFIPQLARLNFKEIVVLEGVAVMPQIPYFHLTVYTLMFVMIFLAWGLHLFGRREFP